MSDLRPKPVEITIAGEKYGILFTLDAIDEIQDKYDLPLSEVTGMLFNERKRVSTLKTLIAILVNKTSKKDLITPEELGELIIYADIKPLIDAIAEAMGISFPKNTDSPNVTSE